MGTFYTVKWLLDNGMSSGSLEFDQLLTQYIDLGEDEPDYPSLSQEFRNLIQVMSGIYLENNAETLADFRIAYNLYAYGVTYGACKDVSPAHQKIFDSDEKIEWRKRASARLIRDNFDNSEEILERRGK